MPPAPSHPVCGALLRRPQETDGPGEGDGSSRGTGLGTEDSERQSPEARGPLRRLDGEGLGGPSAFWQGDSVFSDAIH